MVVDVLMLDRCRVAKVGRVDLGRVVRRRDILDPAKYRILVDGIGGPAAPGWLKAMGTVSPGCEGSNPFQLIGSYLSYCKLYYRKIKPNELVDIDNTSVHSVHVKNTAVTNVTIKTS